MESLSDSITEAREEMMISPTDHNMLSLRLAHFLKPCARSISEDVFPTCSWFPSLHAICNSPKWNLNVYTSKSWRNPQKRWITWVDKMHNLYHSVWKKAGIYDPIMSTKYNVPTNNDVILGLAERWCAETSTFLFPWGEVGITLEDVMVLGGYSVLGDSVFRRLESEEFRIVEEKLVSARKEFNCSKAKKVDQSSWEKKFSETDSDFGHEAFLALWLSRYVFPNLGAVVKNDVFPIAIQLARGTRIALAPAVLACIYRDLRILSMKIRTSHKQHKPLQHTLLSLFHFVQVWAWERFPTLQAKPNFDDVTYPRLVRWHNVKGATVENVRLALSSAGESFLWRPYRSLPYNFYKAEEQLIKLGEGLDEDLHSFALCLRVSELVGLDCIEKYQPHRVAMQFGMDQDLPGKLPRFNETPKIAWKNYSRPSMDSQLYIPPRVSEPAVTTRYLKLWKHLRSQKDGTEETKDDQVIKQLRSRIGKMEEHVGDRNTSVLPRLTTKCKKGEIGDSIESTKSHNVRFPGSQYQLHSSGAIKKRKLVKSDLNIRGTSKNLNQSEEFTKKSNENFSKGTNLKDKAKINGPDVPLYSPPTYSTEGAEYLSKNPSFVRIKSISPQPGFTSKRHNEKLADLFYDIPSKSNTLSLSPKSHGEVGDRQDGHGHDKCLPDKSSSDVKELGSFPKSTKNDMQDVTSGNADTVQQMRSSFTIPGLELEARIRRLEKIIAELKAKI